MKLIIACLLLACFSNATFFDSFVSMSDKSELDKLYHNFFDFIDLVLKTDSYKNK